MKAIFIHDHPFYKDGVDYYSQANFPSNIWERYLSVFESVTVVGRGRIAQDIKGLSLSSRERVNFKLLYTVSGGFDYYLKQKEIRRHLRKLIAKADIVILRLPSFFGICAAEICKELNQPYAVELVGCTWDSNWNSGSILGRLRAPFSFFNNRVAVKNAVAVIYVTEFFLQRRYSTFSNNVSYASNVYIEDFSESVLQQRKLFISKDREYYKLGLLANLQVKYKGFEVVFRALSLAKYQLDKPIELHLYGGGDCKYISMLTEKYNLQGNIKVVGLLSSGEAVYQALDDLDLYVQPSLTEGLPRSVIEAMSRGCPILASSAGGIPELLHEKYLHTPGDYKRLAKQLIETLQNESALVSMSEANFYKAKEYTALKLNQRRDFFWGKVKNSLEDNSEC
ncbi:hypothetical protein AKN93_07055 [Thiopseudomonas alkaliphila]|uniref:glycosyltransferase family 4 protein n=1 Tax=Thiopseudomonas alkaliphila TaxID=1697053 RepID=UPI0006A2FAF9|nr:glycosyltransferase family 4 protein [Thiopseudomonas alkaliphila]AKX49987.1 hypothetical protein AKN93_07055 [Thiopseudomonas alkaliphila]